MKETKIPIEIKNILLNEYEKITEFVKINNYDFIIFENMIYAYVKLFQSLNEKYDLYNLHNDDLKNIYSDDDANCFMVDEYYRYYKNKK